MGVSKERKKELNRAAYLRKKEAEKFGDKISLSTDDTDQRKKDYQWAVSLDDAGRKAPGEFCTYQMLFAIYYGANHIECFKHTIKGEKLTFVSWLEARMQCRINLWYLAERLGYHGLAEKPHRPVIDFFVKKDNIILSSLPDGYTLEEFKETLLKQDTQHLRLLLYPRGFFKTSLVLAEAAQWVINFPDITILSVSSTKILSSKFSREFRSYFVIKDPDDPLRSKSGEFKILYPEFCIPEGKGRETSYRCPIARLDLKEDTFSSTSVEAASAGSRAHVIIFDDIQSERNYRKVAARIEVRETYDAIRELAIPPYSFIYVVGTRWTDGQMGDDNVDGHPVSVPDVYGTILQRINDNDDVDWKVLVKAAWIAGPSATGKKIRDYTPEDIEDFLWGEKQGSFEVLLKKAKDNEELFRCNQLNEPAGELDDDEIYLNSWNEDNIRPAMRQPGILETTRGTTYIFGDTALTPHRKSDYSSFCVTRVETREHQDPMIWFCEIQYGHWTDKQTAVILADLIAKWQPDGGVHIEDIPALAPTFKDEVRRQIFIRNCQHINFRWFKPDPTKGAKEIRIRGLQLLHEKGLLRFIIGPWIDRMMKQLIGYRGDKKLHKRSPGGIKDDLIDSMSFVQRFLPYISGVSKPEDEAIIKARAERQALLVQYDRIYGTSSPLRPQPTAADLEDDKAHNPIHDALAPLFGNRMPRQAFPRKSEGN